jgi:alkylhydroperoxidase/carboxymuconolactone decarboxylase family protein YurZ
MGAADRGGDARADAYHDKGRRAVAGMKEFANLYYCEGALDPKTAQLVAMAAMAAAGCTS